MQEQLEGYSYAVQVCWDHDNNSNNTANAKQKSSVYVWDLVIFVPTQIKLNTAKGFSSTDSEHGLQPDVP